MNDAYGWQVLYATYSGSRSQYIDGLHGRVHSHMQVWLELFEQEITDSGDKLLGKDGGNVGYHTESRYLSNVTTV